MEGTRRHDGGQVFGKTCADGAANKEIDGLFAEPTGNRVARVRDRPNAGHTVNREATDPHPG
jgi:hypothetical protein